ncbi:hypothetical protein RDI58_028957 [Solanum bulbocastanum]|uniref:Uncharacterized protein n=1 Tax=Solanum bulbocastanum TaxID=147425 RepID=A0AAN8SSX6_SOLBU
MVEEMDLFISDTELRWISSSLAYLWSRGGVWSFIGCSSLELIDVELKHLKHKRKSKGRGFWVAVRCWSCSGVEVVSGGDLVLLLLTVCWKTEGFWGLAEEFF